MRIRSISASNTPPVRRFEVSDLSDTIVIAGPNGIGKTRLINALINYFKNFSPSTIHFIVEATDKQEQAIWGKQSLDTKVTTDSQLLKKTLPQNQSRRNFKSSILYYESNRSIQKITPYQFTWDTPDPWEEKVSWDIAFGGLQNRSQDTSHAIFKKIQSQHNDIAAQAVRLRSEGHKTMNLEFEDTLEPFRDAFFKLLGPKKLEKADIKSQELFYSSNGQTFNISSLSSGEREVLNITFDFILRKPSHCVVFFDEPELHLHPELSYKLISTLRTVGDHNQFIFCSHSPDIISSSLEDSVVFLTPDKKDDSNQALLVKPDDSSNEALHRLGHSIGIVSLGKKIVLIEGRNTSLDKQTYGHILKNRFSNLVLLPSSGKGSISNFNNVMTDVLQKSVWGIDFYMLADRDAVPPDADLKALSSELHGKFAVLSKYHLENYFLDEHIIAQVFENMEAPGSWLLDPKQIRNKLKELARERISYATALIASKHFRDKVGNIDLMPKGCHAMSVEELNALLQDRRSSEEKRVISELRDEEMKSFIETTYKLLTKSIEDDTDLWKTEIPGKQLFNMFCTEAKMPGGRLKSLYIKKAEESAINPFQEIISIFEAFSKT
jgi:predicted ATP-binding protein involved in virulence